MNRRIRIFRTIRETAAVLASAALLSSFLPHVLGNNGDPDIQSAKSSCDRVRAALMQYASDTGALPATTPNGGLIDWIVGPGAAPNNLLDEDDGKTVVRLMDVLGKKSDDNIAGYDGPYLQFGGSDTWGRSIVTNISGFAAPTQKIWVLSAGPNGTIETSPNDEEPHGDDIGVLLDLATR